MSQCPPCSPKLSCNDSAYSVAGNTMGILTFVYAILATVWLYVSRLKSADTEQRKLMDTAYANYVRWKLMINEYEDLIKAGGTVTGDFQNLFQHRFTSGGDAMRRLDMALEYDPGSGTVARTRQRGKFVLNQRELHELLAASNNATHEVAVLLDGITQEQIHRELKLQHALLQQVARKIGVPEQATEEMKKLVEEVPDGAPVAALLRTPPLTRDSGGPQLTVATEDTDARSSSESGTSRRDRLEKSEV